MSVQTGIFVHLIFVADLSDAVLMLACRVMEPASDGRVFLGGGTWGKHRQENNSLLGFHSGRWCDEDGFNVAVLRRVDLTHMTSYHSGNTVLAAGCKSFRHLLSLQKRCERGKKIWRFG